MKAFLNKINFRLSYLPLLAAGGIFIALVTLRQDILYRLTPSSYIIPLWVSILMLVLMVGFLAVYFYIEVYRTKDKINPIIAFIFFGLILLNIVAISVEPLSSSVNTFFRVSYSGHEVGDPVSINLIINPDDKAFFIAEIIAILSFAYIAVFIFPRRLKSFQLVAFGIICFFVALVSMLIYSYVTEGSHYINFFKYFFGGHTELDVYTDCTVKSYVPHRNGLAMFYLLSIIFCLVLHSYTKKKYYYFGVAFLYLNMIFTISKASLLFTTLLIIAYFIYRMIVTFKDNKKRNIISLSSVGGLLLIGALLFVVSIVSEGKVLGKLYSLYQTLFEGGRTIDTRNFIWDNVNNLLSNGWWLLGRGHGIFNLFLRPINETTHQDMFVFGAHSSIYEILGEGGLLFLLGYFVLVSYIVYILIKLFKKNFDMSFILSLGFVTFFSYSFIETTHYILYVFMLMVMIVHHLDKKELTVCK